jgi:regulator of protease activity HflC (stomatin/prohibitin superfamily)
MINFLLWLALVWFFAWRIEPFRNKIKALISNYPKIYKLLSPPWIRYLILWFVLLWLWWWGWAVLIVWWLLLRIYIDPLFSKRFKNTINLLTDQVQKKWKQSEKKQFKDVEASVNNTFISSQNTMENLFSVFKKVLFWGIGIILLIIILSKWLPRYTVNPGEIALIKRMGKLQENVATEWLNFKFPIIDTVVRINIQTQKVEATANAASKDLQNISATIAVNGAVLPSFAKELYRNLGDASLVADKIINPSIQESVKAATAKYTAEELITKRTAVSQEIRTLLVEKLEKRWIQVSDVNIVNFQFSADFDAAIEKKVKAEQEALAEKNKLESVKFQAQQSIERSKAEAESIRIQAEAIKSQGWQEYVNLKRIEKRDWKLPQTSLGQSNGLILNLKQ